MNEIFISFHNIYKTRSDVPLEIPFKKNDLSQEYMSFMGPSVWNKWRPDLKVLDITTSFAQSYNYLVLKSLSS